jgi:hypothetical protein
MRVEDVNTIYKIYQIATFFLHVFLHTQSPRQEGITGRVRFEAVNIDSVDILVCFCAWKVAGYDMNLNSSARKSSGQVENVGSYTSYYSRREFPG